MKKGGSPVGLPPVIKFNIGGFSFKTKMTGGCSLRPFALLGAIGDKSSKSHPRSPKLLENEKTTGV